MITSPGYIMVGKVWQQEFKAAGHIVPKVRKKRERNVGAFLAFIFLFDTGPQLVEWSHTLI